MMPTVAVRLCGRPETATFVLADGVLTITLPVLDTPELTLRVLTLHLATGGTAIARALSGEHRHAGPTGPRARTFPPQGKIAGWQEEREAE